VRLVVLLVCIVIMLQPLIGCRKPFAPKAPTLDAALALYEAGELGKARAEVERALERQLGPHLRAEAFVLDAKVLLAMGDFDGAISAIEWVHEPPADLKPDADYVLAKALIFSGHLDLASRLLSSIEASGPVQQDVVKLNLLRAFLATRSHQCEKAVRIADAIISSSEGNLRAEGQFAKGFCLYESRQFDDAFNLMTQAAKGLRPGYERYVAAFVAGHCADAMMRYADSINYYMTALGELRNVAKPDDFKASVESSIERVLLSKLRRDQLRTIIDQFGVRFPADVATFALARLLIRDGEQSEAEEILAKFSGQFPQSALASRAADFHRMIVMGMLGDPGRVGLIAPLSGDLSDFGRQVLLGAKTAISDYCAASEASVSLVVRDSTGDPDVAAEAFIDLAENEKVIAVIGPVLSKSLRGISALATEYRMLALSPSACGAGATEGSRYVFRNCVPLWAQARAIAQFAVRRLHLLRIAVLMPERQYGTQLADSFIKAAENAGAKIVFIKSYPPGEMDFRERLSGLCELEPEAIFIADYASQISVMAPQIQYSNIHDAVLLGWDGWNSPSELGPVLGQLEGAFFVSGFWLADKTTRASELQQRLLLEHNIDCSPLIAQSYDAASIVCKALFRGAFYRQDLRDEVSWLKFRGVLGSYGFTPHGQAARPLSVLTVANGQIVKVCDIEVE